MLPSASRLKLRSDFAAVYARGRSYATDLVVVYVRPNKRQTTRIGFSVSRKLGKSAARNRTKRVLREAARRVLPQLDKGYDVVIVARGAAADAEFSDIVEAVRIAFRKSRILGEGT